MLEDTDKKNVKIFDGTEATSKERKACMTLLQKSFNIKDALKDQEKKILQEVMDDGWVLYCFIIT